MSNSGLNVSAHSREKTSTSATPNSAASPRSDRLIGIAEAGIVAGLLCGLVGLSVFWCFRSGYILYWGDAQSHLNLSRSIIDSRTPGYDQLGTVWLPMLHVICLPFVANDALWSTGLAGSIPVATYFVIAGTCLYLAAREVYASSISAVVVVTCFALNPNILYLASIPMTEMVFLAGLAVLLFALVRFRATGGRGFIALSILASLWMSLTRYDGWFLIPFAAAGLAVFARKRRIVLFMACAGLMSLAPLYWLAHNWWETGRAFDFYNGPYSAIVIQAGRAYPGYHNWRLAVLYYAKASQLCAGWPLVVFGAAGIICGVRHKLYAPLLLLAATPIFFVWSVHSSAQPIHVPQLWPFSYYNTRYGIAVVPLTAFAAGAIVLTLPTRLKRFGLLLAFIPGAVWAMRPAPNNWICWKESQVNSVSRRSWTAAAAEYLRARYHSGQGILTPTASGDLAGIFCQARIPLGETVNEGNGPAWFAATLRPDLFHPNVWAVAQQDDAVWKALAGRARSAYRIARRIQVKDAAGVEIYRRELPSP